MEDNDTATIRLSRAEAQEVINALSNYEVEVSGREEQQVLNVRELLKREFDFEEPDFEGKEFGDENALVDAFVSIFDEDGDHEVRLSRSEAEEIDAALADLERTSGSTEAIEGIRTKVEREFDLTTGDAA